MFFFFKGNYSECNKNMFSALKGLIYLLCHEKINAINTSILLHGEREFPHANPSEWPFSFDFLIRLRLCFSYDFSVIQTLSRASDDFRAGCVCLGVGAGEGHSFLFQFWSLFLSMHFPFFL